jgi:rod shape-determining protein MreC
MYRLFEFFYQFRVFLFFVLLQGISLWLIVQNNYYQGAQFLNSSNRYAGSILETRSEVQEYFDLRQVNEKLAAENARLKQALTVSQQSAQLKIETPSDFRKINRYEFIPAKVVNNSTAQYNNYFTINKGHLDGLKEGMGVVGQDGVVGRIKTCSDHYCTAYSVLHKNFTVSGKIKGQIECNVRWEGQGPHVATLFDVTINHTIKNGDTVFTSGYNAWFPEGIMVGKINNTRQEGGSFWKGTVDLATDFTALNYVYVIGNKLEAEKDSLERSNRDHHEGQ